MRGLSRELDEGVSMIAARVGQWARAACFVRVRDALRSSRKSHKLGTFYTFTNKVDSGASLGAIVTLHLTY
jgi:hypothetical protein